MPSRYPKVATEPWNGLGVRKCVVDNYTVYYLIDENEQCVNVFRVAYNSRNLKNVLEKNMKIHEDIVDYGN